MDFEKSELSDVVNLRKISFPISVALHRITSPELLKKFNINQNVTGEDKSSKVIKDKGNIVTNKISCSYKKTERTINTNTMEKRNNENIPKKILIEDSTNKDLQNVKNSSKYKLSNLCFDIKCEQLSKKKNITTSRKRKNITKTEAVGDKPEVSTQTDFVNNNEYLIKSIASYIQRKERINKIIEMSEENITYNFIYYAMKDDLKKVKDVYKSIGNILNKNSRNENSSQVPTKQNDNLVLPTNNVGKKENQQEVSQGKYSINQMKQTAKQIPDNISRKMDSGRHILPCQIFPTFSQRSSRPWPM